MGYAGHMVVWSYGSGSCSGHMVMVVVRWLPCADIVRVRRGTADLPG